MTALDDLPRLVQEAEPAALPSIIAALEGAKAAAWARLVAPREVDEHSTEDHARCIDVPKAAALLDLHESQVYEMIRQRRLPSVRMGKYVRVPVAELRKTLERQFNTVLNSRRERRAG